MYESGYVSDSTFGRSYRLWFKHGGCRFDQRPSLQTQQNIYKACLDMVPELADFPIVKHWAGLRPSSPTGVPYIGPFP